MLNADEQDAENRRQRNARYPGQLMLMTVGAMFLSFSLVATEEMILIAYKLTAWHTLALIALTLLLMHAFVGAHVYRERASKGASHLTVFARFTVVGYAIVLAVSAYVLWTFGRLDGVGFVQVSKIVAVLACLRRSVPPLLD